jgi:hypothetical protein
MNGLNEHGKSMARRRWHGKRLGEYGNLVGTASVVAQAVHWDWISNQEEWMKPEANKLHTSQQGKPLVIE